MQATTLRTLWCCVLSTTWN